MRSVSFLLLLLSLQARAEDAPPVDAPGKWGTASFQDHRPQDFRKLAEELLPDLPAPPVKPAPDKTEKPAAK